MSYSNDSMIREIFLLKVSPSPVGDIIHLFVVTPLGILGTILMFLSLVIFFKKDFRKICFFQYLQVYTLNSLIQAVTLSFMFLKAPRFLFEISINIISRIYWCKILNSYVVALLFFYGDLIYILLNLERIAQFTKKLDKFKRIHPYLACFILLIICELVNSPTHFVYEVTSDYDIETALSSLSGALNFKRLCPKSSFGLSAFGQGLNIFGYVVKGLVTLLIDLASNLASVYVMRRFFKKKLHNKLHADPTVTVGPHNLKKERAEKSKINQMRMIIYMTAYTVILHVIQFVCDFILLLPSVPIMTLISVQLMLTLLAVVKPVLNFFFYFSFNRKFRDSFKGIFIRADPKNTRKNE